MRKKNIIIIISIIILVIIGIILFIFTKKSDIITSFQDDFIFFKIFNNSNNQVKNNIKYHEKESYIFDVKYNNLQMKNVNLVDTINPKTLVKERIAPGTQGHFYIILKSNKNSKYNVRFVSKNTKPKNLIFYIQNDENKYTSLEELEKVLAGTIEANKQEIIKVNWIWEYSVNNTEDMEDTKDGKNINKYNFDIYVIGKE